MNLRLLAKYPFLPEAREILSEVSIGDVVNSNDYEDVRELGFERLRASLTGEKINLPFPGNDRNDRLLFFSFVVAKLILIAMQDPLVTRRFANVERDRLVDRLTDSPEDIETVAQGLRLRFRKEEDGYYIYFIDFIRYAKNFSTDDFRLLYQPLKNGWLPISTDVPVRRDKKKKGAKNRFTLIIREAFVSRFVEDVEAQADKADFLGGAFKEYIEELKKLKDEYVSSYTQVDLGDVNVDAFPPCMKTIIAKIQQGVNVSHEARFSLVAFLHRIGMSNDDILKVFATVPDFRKDLTEYQIKHITGEISGKEYSVPKCATMRAFGLCVSDVANDKLCEKKWMTHPLLYYKIKKEALAKKVPSRQSESAEEQ